MSSWNNEEEQSADSLVMDFATDEAKPNSFEPIPPGAYQCLVEKIVVKATKDGQGKIANVQLKVTEGEHVGRVVFDGINVMNKSDKAQAIGRGQLAALLEAAGMPGARDLAQVIGSEVLVNVKIQAAKDDYEARNIVRGYKALGGAVAAPQAAAPVAEGKKAAPAFMTKKAPQPPAAAR